MEPSSSERSCCCSSSTSFFHVHETPPPLEQNTCEVGTSKYSNAQTNSDKWI